MQRNRPRAPARKLDAMSDTAVLVLLTVALAALCAGLLAALLRRPAGDWRAPAAFGIFLGALVLERLVLPTLLIRRAGHAAQHVLGWRVWSREHVDALHVLGGWLPSTQRGPAAWVAAFAVALGLWLLVVAAIALARAQRSGALATTGPYAWMRHPQHAGYALVAFGLLVFWPGWLALAVFPALAAMLWMLAREEDAALARRWGAEWSRWAARTPWRPRRRAAS